MLFFFVKQPGITGGHPSDGDGPSNLNDNEGDWMTIRERGNLFGCTAL